MKKKKKKKRSSAKIVQLPKPEEAKGMQQAKKELLIDKELADLCIRNLKDIDQLLDEQLDS